VNPAKEALRADVIARQTAVTETIFAEFDDGFVEQPEFDDGFSFIERDTLPCGECHLQEIT
jgi:hypothetical protein